MKSRWLMLGSACVLAAACTTDGGNTETVATGGSSAEGGSGAEGGGDSVTTTGGAGGTSSVTTGGGGGGGSAVTSIAAADLQSGTACGSQTSATLTWVDNSDNETEFRIERSVAGANAYSVIGTVGANVTTYSDTSVTGGGAQAYRVVAVNADGEATSNSRIVALGVPAQTATIQIDTANGNAVTVTSQPSRYTLTAGGPATWAGVGNPMTVNVELENSGMDRLVFNPKIVVTTVTDSGTVTGDGAFDGDGFVYYGPEALDLGAATDRNIVIDNLTAPAAPVEVTVTILDHPMLVGASSSSTDSIAFVDAGGTQMGTGLDHDQWGDGRIGGSSGSGSGMGYSVVSPDGRYVYLGARNQPILMVVDMVTMEIMVSGDLMGNNNLRFDGSATGSSGSTKGVAISPDGEYLYVTLATETPHYDGGDNDGIAVNWKDEPIGTLEVVRVNRSTLELVDSVTLLEGVAGNQIHGIQLSADGKRGITSVVNYEADSAYTPDTTHGRFFVVDLENMTLVDGDPAPGDQQASFNLSHLGFYAGPATLSADGNTAYIVAGTTVRGSDDDFLLYSVDLATAVPTVLTPPTVVPIDMKEVVRGPNGRIFWTDDTGVLVYDPSDDSWEELAGSQAGRIVPSGSGCDYFRMNRTTPYITWHQLSDHALINNPANGSGEIDNDPPGSTSVEGHHMGNVTPF